jgi:PKD repeat protein
MKNKIKYALGTSFIMVLAIGLTMINSCKEETLSLETKPTADFNATVQSDGHTVLLTTKTSTPVMSYWAAPALNLGFADLKGDSVKLNFIFPGTYIIKMIAVGAGGLDSISKNITTTVADPAACSSTTALGFLASCTQKTWRLNPAPGAVGCGQWAGDQGWWANGTGDVTGRSCIFNDEYTFKFNAAGDFIFDDKGDFYAEDYSGDPTWSCRASSSYPANQQGWKSGNFKYVVIPNAGAKGLGQIKVIGTGAHLGLQKPINNNEVTNSSTTSVTYDIWSMQKGVTDATGTYDLLTLTFHYGNWSATEGWWTYRLRSY